MSSSGPGRPSARTPLDAARDYLARGWQPLPLPARAKAPRTRGWQHLRLTEPELAEHFGGTPGNIGVLLGEPSGGLVDVDLDSPEALALAERLLPPTASRFGRPSKPGSHRLYVAHPLPETEQFIDAGVDGTRPGAMLVELRATGAQTVFPPSVHPGGESVAVGGGRRARSRHGGGAPGPPGAARGGGLPGATLARGRRAPPRRARGRRAPLQVRARRGGGGRDGRGCCPVRRRRGVG